MDGPNRVLQFYGVLNEFIGFVLITNNSNNMNMQLNECYNFTLYKCTYTHTLGSLLCGSWRTKNAQTFCTIIENLADYFQRIQILPLL